MESIFVGEGVRAEWSRLLKGARLECTGLLLRLMSVNLQRRPWNVPVVLSARH